MGISIPPSINSRLFSAIFDGYSSTSDPTTTMKDQLNIASEEFANVLTDLKKLIELDVKNLENKMEAAGAPYTPGRLPDYKKN